MTELTDTAENLLTFAGEKKYNTIYADPPWQFQNRTGKVAPEHKRLKRYETMTLKDIKELPVPENPNAGKTRWICTVCGYVHTGDEPPEKCPVCGQPASVFKKM